MSKQSFIIAIFLFQFSQFLYSQDIAITLSAVDFQTPVELDSIRLNNLSNGTEVTFADLPNGITDYRINLSKGQLLNASYNIDIQKWGIFQFTNEPGLICIRTSLPVSDILSFQLFNLTGAPVDDFTITVDQGEQIIKYCPKINGLGVLIARSSGFRETFKVIGTGVDIPPQAEAYPDKLKTSKPQMITPVFLISEFIFNLGDTLQFTVWKQSYHSGSAVKKPQNNDFYSISLCPATVITDFDGNGYNAVQIGEQCWIKENITASHYSDGTPLADGTGSSFDPGDTVTKYWFNYEGNPVNGAVYGKLYSWQSAMNGYTSEPSSQGICPNGWHVPSDEEWQALEVFLGMSLSEALQMDFWRGTDEGGKLKEEGTEHWSAPNLGATNESNFTALPGGGRFYGGNFAGLTHSGFYWTSSTIQGLVVTYREMDWDKSTIYKSWIDKYPAFSVRCIKNKID